MRNIFFRWIVKPFALASAAIFLSLAVFATADAVFRASGSSITGATELSATLLVVAVALIFAYTQQQEGNIGVELVTDMMSPLLKKLCAIAARIISFAICILITYGCIQAARHSYLINEYKISIFNVPIWPAKIMLALGFALVSVQLIFQIAADIGKPLSRFERTSDASALNDA